MLDIKVQTLLTVAQTRNFTRAAEELSLTQPAVSNHIRQLEQELDVRLFVRGKGELLITPQGEIVLKYARRMKALDERMHAAIKDSKLRPSRLRIGITHTAESNLITEVLARYSSRSSGISITIITETINNLYSMLESYELDLAIVEGRPAGHDLNSLLLDTDTLVCVMSSSSPLAKRQLVTLAELKKQQMILRLPTSATRLLFESHLESIGESISDFNVILEVDSIAAIKDLIRKDLGVSILARSTCMDELRKGKLVALPIENLSMIREVNIVYPRDFTHGEILTELLEIYRETSSSR